MMHPIIHHELTNARIADVHRRAEQDRLARACIRTRRMRRKHGTDPVGGAGRVVTRRLRIILGARGA
jgi:hypothetical protein